MAKLALTTTARGSALERIRSELAIDPRLKSQRTVEGYWRDLVLFEDWRGGAPMTKTLVEQYASHLQDEGKSPSTINRSLAAIRWWSRRMSDIASDDDMMPTAQRDTIIRHSARIATVRDIRGRRAQKGRHVGEDERDRLLAVCEGEKLPTGTRHPAGVRDAAIITLLLNTGVRRSELVGLKLSDIKRGEGKWWALVVRGKGDKVREIPIAGITRSRIADWLSVRGNSNGPLLCPITKAGHVLTGRDISDEALAKKLKKRVKQAGIEHTTPHDMRRTFAGSLLDAGADILTVQGLLGHSSPATTSLYDRRGGRAKEKAIEKMMGGEGD